MKFTSVLVTGAIGLALGGFIGAAQAEGLGGDSLASDKPIHITAENGIEWQQSNRVYIARGHATATRGDGSVAGDVLYAYYRPARATSTNGEQKPPSGASTLMAGTGGSTEIYRIEADGHVRFTDADRIGYGDHAVYDVDQAVLVITGKNLRIETPRETITARDTLEWYDKKQIAVARGDAIATRDDRRIRGDVLTAEAEKPDNQPAKIRRVDAYGHVFVSTPDQIAQGSQGVYDLETGIATLIGDVKVTKGDNELTGQYAVVDTNNNVSRILAAPPNSRTASGGKQRVEGLLVRSPVTHTATGQ
ncbi:MAG TPA: LptA/OstA family protein [Stellaceae bacterium]|nr:LptA/OstA family protein [Stellaceae bacterium]